MSFADSRYPAVADLDLFLGDPRQPGTPFSYRAIVESEEEALGGAFADGRWLVLCLHRLIQRLDLGRELPEAHLALMEESILHSLREDTPFTLTGLARP